jgi:hypothetical protein
VAAVEGVGARLVQLEHCNSCGSNTGARRRFQAALKLVLNDPEARKLLRNYDLRSGAAHGDLIEGQPLTVDNYTRAGMFYVSPEHELRGRIWDMRQASKKVLENVLSEQTA